MPLFSKGWWKLSRNPFSNPKEGQIFCHCYPLVDPLVTTCWLKASLYGVKHTPRATLMGQMFNILLPQRSKQWALILLQCPDTLTLTPGNSFPLPFHCHGWSRSQPAVEGLTAALVYPGLPAEADDRAIASSLHAKLIYAQATWIMRRKALGNHHKGYLMVHKWCPALKNLCSRSGSKINILVLLKLPQIYNPSPAECGRAEHHARARQKKNFTKCHAWRLLCQKPGSYPDFQMTLLLALRWSQCYCSPPCWWARRSSTLLNEWGMEMAEQLSKIP